MKFGDIGEGENVEGAGNASQKRKVKRMSKRNHLTWENGD